MSSPLLPKACVIGSPPEETEALLASLSRAGYDAQAMETPLWEGLQEAQCHLLVLDLRGPFEALSSIEKAKIRCPEASVLVLVPKGGLALAVAAMKSGAELCLSLPVRPERLQASAQSFGRAFDLKHQVARMKQALRSRTASEEIIGNSRALKRCLELCRLVADYPLNVLLTGESGAGKEAMANLIHQSSGRSAKPFVAVDCGALAADLADGELFGIKKGAFTGAENDRPGRFLEADGGTLFLDEIGNLPQALQAKLLRVLQAKEVWPLGAEAPQPVDLRVVAATNEDLPQLVKEGRFRLDLFHRLNEFSLRVPSLRERSEDIEALALFFLNEISHRFGRPTPVLDSQVLEHLKAYPWPGNVRQLQNAMKHACVMAKQSVTKAELPAELLEMSPARRELPPAEDGQFFSVPEGMLTLWQAEERVTAEVERRMISEALILQRGDKTAAAESLGIHVKTLGRKLKEHGLQGLLGT